MSPAQQGKKETMNLVDRADSHDTVSFRSYRQLNVRLDSRHPPECPPLAADGKLLGPLKQPITRTNRPYKT
jgi:hypothetical protein